MAASIGNFYEESRNILIRAIDADNSHQYAQALTYYINATEYLMVAFTRETNAQLKQSLEQRLNSIMTRCEQLRSILIHQSAQTALTTTATPSSGAEIHKMEAAPSHGSSPAPESSSMGSWFMKETPNVQWDEVVGLAAAKQVIIETFDIPLRFPSIYEGNRKPWSGMLLYGPPGTGKTYLVKAMATKLDATFFSVKSSDIVSKYQGDSEKNIRQLFSEANSCATAKNPVIIFFDEIDALCIDRNSQQGGGGDGAQTANIRVVTQLLQEMDGFSSINSHVFIVAATNLPWLLDTGILRRFQRTLYIPLPTLEDRKTILTQALQLNHHLLSDADILAIGEATELYSGSDLNIIALESLMLPVRDMINATQFFKYPGTQKWVPILDTEDLPAVAEKFNIATDTIEIRALTWTNLEDRDIDSQYLPVTKKHVLAAIKNHPPITSTKRLKEYDTWSATREQI